MMARVVSLARRLGLYPPLPLPRPGLVAMDGWAAATTDAPPLNAELRDVTPEPTPQDEPPVEGVALTNRLREAADAEAAAGTMDGPAFRAYQQHMLGAAVPGTNPSMSPGHGGDSPGTGREPTFPTRMTQRLDEMDARLANRWRGRPEPTPEQVVNGTCHPDPDHGCTGRRPPRPAPTPVPGPGRKQSR